MRPILPPDSTRVRQPEIGLVHERCGLQGMPRALTCHVDACQPMEFVVDERRQAGERVLIAAVPGEQQLGDIARRSGFHEEWQERRDYTATRCHQRWRSHSRAGGWLGRCGSQLVSAYQGRQVNRQVHPVTGEAP